MSFSFILAFFVASIAVNGYSSRGRRNSRRGSCSVDTLSSELTDSQLLLQTDANYTTYRTDQFANYLGSSSDSEYILSPNMILVPNNEDDISTVTSFANRCGYVIAVRSGGHQYSGLSSCSMDYDKCIQIDMSNFLDFEPHYDDENVLESFTIGVGHRIESMQELLYPLDGIFPHGICANIGLGGHFQSSAIGYLSRSLGLGVDYVESFRIVLADGSIEDVTVDSHPDLFALVIGGNPGSIGIVTQYTINVVLISDFPDAFTFRFAYIYTRDTYQALAEAYLGVLNSEEFQETFDLSITLFLAPGTIDGVNILPIITAHGVWTGKDHGDFYEGGYDELFLTPILNAATPISVAYNNGSLSDAILLQTTRIPTNVQLLDGLFIYRHEISAAGATETLPTDLITNTIDAIDEILSTDGLSMVIQIVNGGGQPGLNTDTGNGFPWRGFSGFVAYWVLFEEDEDAQIARDYLNELVDTNADFWYEQGPTDLPIKLFAFTKGSQEIELNEQWQSFYPDRQTYRAHMRTKRRYDRNNVFRHKLSIPTRGRN